MTATQKQLDSIRTKIAVLVDERAETANAAITRQEAEARFEHLIARVRDDAILGMGPSGLRNGGDERTFGEWLSRRGTLCEILGAEIKTALLARFDAEVGAAPEGLPAIERRKKLSALDAQIYALEADEERMIEALEDQGVDVIRRPDANPHAALGLPGKAA